MNLSPKTEAPPRRQNLIGIFGIPGSGKTRLLNQLRKELEGDPFSFHEFEEVKKDAPGGHRPYDDAFDALRTKCDQAGVTGIATATYTLLDESDYRPYPIMLDEVYEGGFTHIIYLKTPTDEVYARCQAHGERRFRKCPREAFCAWVDHEIRNLQRQCSNRDTLLTIVYPYDLPQIVALIQSFRLDQDEEYNQGRVNEYVDKTVAPWQGHVERVLVLDGDNNVLTPKKEEQIFWEKYYFGDREDAYEDGHRLLPIEHHWYGYKHNYFNLRQASLIYEQVEAEGRLDETCRKAASAIALYPQIKNILHRVSKCSHLRIIIVTSRLRLLWETILAQEGLSNSVTVIGSGPVSNGYVVTPSVKEALVERLTATHHFQVWAFGNSDSSIDMFRRAHYSVILCRPKDPTGYDGRCASDTVLEVKTSKNCLDATSLRLTELEEPGFLDKLVQHQFTLAHATHKAVAKLLHTGILRTRDLPPHLQPKIYNEAGWYLASEYISELRGLEAETENPKDPEATGYQLVRESRVHIVPMNDDGNYMACGIRDAFKNASFQQASQADDVDFDHIEEKDAVVLVQSVVYSAHTITRFVHHIRRMKPGIHVFVVAGVIQAELVAPGGPLPSLNRDGPITVVALSLAKGKDMVTKSHLYETEPIFRGMSATFKPPSKFGGGSL
ncbi:hypothetical protein AbraIFM66950_002440 [Aspergillus brasiliensis]|nr:hypothetical protein AbraIFM66950_002440 [Aspergillus brasiliensis]